MADSFGLKIEGMQGLLNSFNQLPPACRDQVLLPAVRRASKTMERAIRPFIPRGHRRKTKPHYQDALLAVVRSYPKTQSITAIIGAESGVVPHKHLVEEGTKARWTNHKSQYKKIAVRAKQIIKRGKLKWVVDRKRQSIGSFAKKNKRPTFYRGIMPAFHSVRRGVKSCEGSVASQLKTDIQDRLGRLLASMQVRDHK